MPDQNRLINLVIEQTQIIEIKIIKFSCLIESNKEIIRRENKLTKSIERKIIIID